MRDDIKRGFLALFLTACIFATAGLIGIGLTWLAQTVLK